MNRRYWLDSVVAMIGVWLVASPWILTYRSPDAVGLDIGSSNASWNFIIVGIALFLLGFIAITSYRLWRGWLDVAAAVWLIVSPWVLGYQAIPAMWNAIICGFAVIGISGWVILSDRSVRVV
ncbi:MAG: SPW repeat protein [Phyllobacterium sp.]|uniref:SPW repeat protein n=1 Tax=Phyllobacterium sp. TaxID=1871046 RepID=UPI0030F26DAD